MPHHLVLLAHRDMRLVVFVDTVIPGRRIAAARPRLDVEVVRLPAALVDEIARQIHVPRLAGEAGELDQRQLDLLVTAIAAKLALAATEGARDQVGIAAHHVEQLPFARGGGIGDRAFHQMAGAVQLVPVAQVAEPSLRSTTLEVAVEITVRLLCRLDTRDDAVDHRLQLLVALCGQRVGGSLDPLADVGVPVHHRRGRLGADRGHLMGDRQRIGRRSDIEGGEDAGLLVLLVQERNRGIAHRGLARRPEPVVECNRGERHRPRRSHRHLPVISTHRR